MPKVQIVDERTHQVLAYIDALNRHNLKPTEQMVAVFAKNPFQRRTSPMAGDVFKEFRERWTQDQESFCEYLERLSLLTRTGDGVELTRYGRALLKTLNTPVMDDATTDVVEIVLRPENPFAYAQALDALGTPARALLVDPYFRLAQLINIAELDNIERVLLGPLRPADCEALANGLGALPEGRALEARRAKALHDRYLIPKNGGVLMLGASLNGIGKSVSTMATLGPEASQALRQVHESIWSEAERIEPRPSGA